MVAVIDYTKARESLQSDDTVISTPFGLVVIEIQGELNIPSTTHSHESIKLLDINHAIKFGKLFIEDNNSLTLYIGNSQRLLGTIETLKTPLGVLKIPLDSDQTTIDMVDVVKKKLVFRDRPLPIMS